MTRKLVIVGGGPGGYVAAIRAAQLGAKVSLIEAGRLGGTCLNRGCIPTKALYENARVLNTIKQSEVFGINVKGYDVDIKRMNERKQQIVEGLVSGIDRLLRANGVEVINGTGTFADKETIVVAEHSGKRYEVKGENILIATGSLPSVLPIPGTDLQGVVTSARLLETAKIPSSLVVIGGGVVGTEFAGIYNAFGTDVTVMEYMPRILPDMDHDLGKRLTPALKRKGIRVHTGVEVKGIFRDEEGLIVKAEGQKGEIAVKAEKVLVSTGRRMNAEGLNLDAAGIDYDEKGIKVNENFATNIPGIYAIGDVIEGPMLAHVASDEGKAAVENMLGLKGHINYDAVHSCVFSFPEVAAVGLTEQQAKERGIPYLTGKFMFNANGKALTMEAGEGFIKAVAAKETKEIIGVHMMGPHASDLIHEAALAVTNKLTISQIARTLHTHPTLSEAFLEAVLGLENRAIHAAPNFRK